MNHARLLLFWCLLFPFSLAAQRFIPSQLEEALLADQLLGQINTYRAQNGLAQLAKHPILALAAKDQVRYIQSLKKLTHEQMFTGKKTLKERINSHGGVFGQIHESIAFVPFQSDYEAQAKAIFEVWKQSKEDLKAMLQPMLRFSSIHFAIDKNAEGIYVVQVYGGTSFEAPRGVETVADAHGIEAYQATACKRVTANGYMAADLPLHLRLFGSSIYLEYHDRGVLQEMIAAPGDALAIDIIHQDQFKCQEENNFHPSPVHDGVMLMPVPYEVLYKTNQHPDSNRLYTYLGTIPEALKKEAIQLNVIAINQNKACESNFPVGVPFGDLPLFRINPIWAFEDLGAIPSIKVAAVRQTAEGIAKVANMQEEFALSFGKSGVAFEENQWEKVRQFVDAQKEQIDSIVVSAFSSIEGNTSLNLELQVQRAQNILQALIGLGLPASKIRTKAEENWPLFYQQILGTSWARFAGMDKATVKRQLANALVEQELSALLAEQREAKLQFYYKAERNEAFSPYQLAQTSSAAKTKLSALQAAINSNSTKSALSLQEELIRLFLDFEVNLADLSAIHIPITKENLSLLSNALAIDLFFKTYVRTDQQYIHRLDTILQLAPQYLPMQFNYLGFAVRYFYQEKKSLEPPEQLSAKILALYTPQLAAINYQDIQQDLDRLMINFHLAAVDYHFYNRRYQKRDQSMRAIQDFFSDQQISEAEALALARFFNKNYYIDWSIAILNPYLLREEMSEDLLFTYFQTLTIQEGSTRDESYYQWMDLCLQRNKTRLCHWLSTYFQLLRDDKIKQLYCAACE
ncbi:MAG: CAP domain-containing protein [Saprospiraceae bacterium]